mmetsp:Transcript_22860/g.90652  ORF Transcript_22860/g.90652 Transcript_22860/m.90652 type:complete len:444 (+) Transcript_22860:207-1538(+)
MASLALRLLVTAALLVPAAAAPPAGQNCTGDLVWSDCHTFCPNICGEPEPDGCVAACFEGCACPDDSWRKNADEDICYETADECPLGADHDEHGCSASAGYTWCEARRACVRLWERPCDCETRYDEQDNCVPENCISWFDGCNWCGLDWEAGEMWCTEMWCEVLDEPRCECDTLFDARGNCVETECAKWYDGCATCAVDWTAGELRCDEQPCGDQTDAARCLCDTMLDHNGNCIEAECANWNDGCNDCGVNWETGQLACTERACFTLNEPFCNSCESGLYDTYGFCVPSDCVNWYDGCNGCGVDWETRTFGPCTMRYCSDSEREEAYCSEFAEAEEDDAPTEPGGGTSKTKHSSRPSKQVATIGLVVVVVAAGLVLAALGFVAARVKMGLTPPDEDTPLSSEQPQYGGKKKMGSGDDDALELASGVLSKKAKGAPAAAEDECI